MDTLGPTRPQRPHVIAVSNMNSGIAYINPPGKEGEKALVMASKALSESS